MIIKSPTKATIYKSYTISVSEESYNSTLQSASGEHVTSNGSRIRISSSGKDYLIVWPTHDLNGHDVIIEARIVMSSRKDARQIKVIFSQDKHTTGYKNAAILIGSITLVAGIIKLGLLITQNGIEAITNLWSTGLAGWFVTSCICFVAASLRQSVQIDNSPLAEAVDEFLVSPLSATEIPWEPSLIERLGYIS